jgi:hypothetical protein
VLPDPSLKHVVFERLATSHSSERPSVDGCSPLREVCSSGARSGPESEDSWPDRSLFVMLATVVPSCYRRSQTPSYVPGVSRTGTDQAWERRRVGGRG